MGKGMRNLLFGIVGIGAVIAFILFVSDARSLQTGFYNMLGWVVLIGVILFCSLVEQGCLILMILAGVIMFLQAPWVAIFIILFFWSYASEGSSTTITKNGKEYDIPDSELEKYRKHNDDD